MTAELRAARIDRLSLLDRLQAAVRPEFAVELIRTDPANPVFARGQCRVTGCERGAWSKFLCNGHYGRWTREGRPQLAAFAMTTGPMARHSDRIDAFDLRGLPLQLRLEVAYSIQIRHDQRTIRLVPMMINRLVRLVIAAKVGSLLDHGLERWTLLAHEHGLTDTGGRAMGQLRFAWRHVLDLAEGIDTDAEFARDTWRAAALGARPSPKKVPPIRFDHIPQPWLRDAVKRACRYRLGAGKQQQIGLHDETGQPVTVTAHQYRHTLGTRLINAGVPQHVVQKMLGHASPQMTARYATIHDATIRAAFDDYQQRRVDIHGDRLAFDPYGPSAEAEWIKHNLARVQASLPNGYCGRPPQQDCPHPNACLTCPDFQTTATFLPIHRRQHDDTLELIDLAEQHGNRRLADNHRKVADNLTRIIAALETLDRKDPSNAG
jgi:hypothetical protein